MQERRRLVRTRCDTATSGRHPFLGNDRSRLLPIPTRRVWSRQPETPHNHGVPANVGDIGSPSENRTSVLPPMIRTDHFSLELRPSTCF